jgi:hypothetical protein
MPTDPKWRTIARKSGQPLPCVIALFNLIMVNASGNADDRGTLHNWNDDDAAAALDIEPEAVAAIIAAMQGKVLEANRLTGWEKRQPKREDDGAAARKAAQRERQRTQAGAVSHNVTQGHAPEIDTDAEIDAERLEANASCASGDALKPEHVVEIWNDTAPKLGKPKVRSLTPARRELLKARIGQYELTDFQDVFCKIERSPFLRGDKGWSGCTFDWVFKRANFQKILEGNYDQ